MTVATLPISIMKLCDKREWTLSKATTDPAQLCYKCLGSFLIHACFLHLRFQTILKIYCVFFSHVVAIGIYIYFFVVWNLLCKFIFRSLPLLFEWQRGLIVKNPRNVAKMYVDICMILTHDFEPRYSEVVKLRLLTSIHGRRLQTHRVVF